ncbi:hypothetical protein AAFF_G00272730 [Aldrovandia affinis]|uniref:Latent transforming growth factor beta binding protein 3 n=1 Tax=Aldrovandia affinis TaxID=143900 RepID=A0AAD7W2M7_9TELE|nr:hypothetical protein AAFF_G00272730 [Aldrovandia affinis]
MPSLIALHVFIACLGAHRMARGAERFKVVIAPLICKRTCFKGQCQDTCEQGNNTTLIGENGQSTDTLTGPGFRVVVCPLTCMNGGVCSSRTHCLCPPGFVGRQCQFPLRPVPEAQGARGNKQPVYTLQDGAGTLQLAQTHSVFTLQRGTHHSSEVQFLVRVHHAPDTSVVIHQLDQGGSGAKPPKTALRLIPQTQKPKGRCFQETTPKNACRSNPLPGLTNQEDCCGSVGNSWGQNKCYKCPDPLYFITHKPQTIVEDQGSACPHGYKRLNTTHCQDINECTMQGVCQDGQCLNTPGSFLCACKLGYILDRTRCVAETQVELGPCFRMVTEGRQCVHAFPTELSRETCCCTVGKAWGGQCDRCPQDGTASFSKICPAGKGYSYQTYRGILTFPPQIPNLDQVLRIPRVEKGSPQPEAKLPVPVEMTTPMQVSTLSTHGPRIPVIVSKPTPPPVVKLHPERGSFGLAQTQAPPTDECKLDRNICGHGECVNSLGGFSCHCNAGYRSHPQRKSCVDEDECQSRPVWAGAGLLHQHHGVVPLPLPAGVQADVCEDINECLDPSACPNEQCENMAGSNDCMPCRPGHQAQAGVCYDIDECQERGVCLNGRCENLPGTYRCLCDEGFLHESDSKGCRDIDECEDHRLCANGHCVNTEGSFLCQCYPGYKPTKEGSHCEDINECERPVNCQRGRCINTMGAYRCECPKGFMLVNGRRCQDVDECGRDRGLCQPHGVCENRPGAYVCVCNDGFISSEDKRSCEEIEVYVDDKKECYLNLDDTVFCDSVLATNITKQECCCSIGVGWGDQCEIYPCPVHHSAEFHSLCPIGRGFYNQEGMTEYGLAAHRDIDECVLFSNEICKEGRCMNTQPGYECYCQQGFYYDSNLLECIDVDECHDESLCANGRCMNTRGSYHCTCDAPGPRRSQQAVCDPHHLSCVVGVDECQDPTNCKNGRCVDTLESFYCICIPPFILATDRNGCVTPEEQADVNECQDPAYCKNGRCVNTPGSFHCICAQPLTFSAALKQCVYDDRTAAHKDVCFMVVHEDLICSIPRKDIVVTYSECCCHYGRGWGPECRTCPQRNSVIFNRLCQLHLETESDGEGDFLAAFANYNQEGDSSEEDSDECSCANGRCVRSYLGTMCECNPGFRLDHSRTRCVDIDECAEQGARMNSCKNARCVNTVGSFKCFCKHGYIPARRPNICVRPRAL